MRLINACLFHFKSEIFPQKGDKRQSMTLLFNSLQKNTLRFKVFASYCYLNNNKYVNSLKVHQISALDFPIRDFNKRTVFVCQEKKKLYKNMNNFAFQELNFFFF